jgi:glycine/D-amino acid oxidase-like deaminating enzyme
VIAMHDTTRTIVLGGGIAGLTTAAVLARAGGEVIVRETAPVLGGRGRSTDHDGTAVNMGPHAMYLAGPGITVLRDLDIDLSGGLPPATHVRLLSNGELQRPLRGEPGGVIGGGARLAGSLARLARAALRDAPDAAMTGSAWLHRVLGDHPARPMITAAVRVATYGNLLDVQSAQVAVAQVLASRRVRYVRGGWRRIVEQLHDRVVAAGGQVRTAARPATVLVEGDRVRGVVDNRGDVVPASAVVVATGGPDATLRAVAGTPAADTLVRATHGVRPARAAVLDVVLSRRPGGLRPFVIGVDEPLFLTTPTDSVSHGGPAGRTVLQMVRYLDIDEPTGAAHRPRMEALLDQAAPRWRDLVVDARFLPAMAVSPDAGLAATGGLSGRVPVDASGVGGLFLAGDWVGEHGYLAHASLHSAAAAARMVVRTWASRVTAARPRSSSPSRR